MGVVSGSIESSFIEYNDFILAKKIGGASPPSQIISHFLIVQRLEQSLILRWLERQVRQPGRYPG